MSPRIKNLQRKHTFWAIISNVAALAIIGINAINRHGNIYLGMAGPLLMTIPTVVNIRLYTLLKRLRKRVAEKHCFYCNYDLRASKDICPECGKAILPAIECTRCHTLNLDDEVQCWKCERQLVNPPPLQAEPQSGVFVPPSLESVFDKAQDFKKY